MEMNRYRFALGAALIAASFGITPMVGAQTDEGTNSINTLMPSSDWSVSSRSDRCRLSRNFGSGDDQVTVRIEKGGTEPTFNLSLFGNAVANPVGAVVSIQFGPGQEAFGRTYIAAKSSTRRSVLLVYGASYAATVENEDGGYTVIEPEQAEFTEMQYLEIERAGLTPFRLDFDGSLAEIAQAMNECTGALAGKLQVAATGQSKPPEPSGNPGRWVQPKDYPAMMLSYSKEGLVRFRLTVSKSGKPTFCAIDSSTLPQMFDNSACLALLRNAAFEPALDWEGNPIESYWRSAIRFEIR